MCDSQVFTMQQTATVLVESVPDRPFAEHLVNHIAEEQGLPCKQDLLSDAAECLSEQEWKTFAQYAEDIDCFKKLHDDSVPIAISKAKITSRLTLY